MALLTLFPVFDRNFRLAARDFWRKSHEL